MQAHPPKPLQYLGGKDWLLPIVLPALRHTPARIYVEPFLGSASVFLRKEPHPVEVINDYDKLIYTIYKYIQDERIFRKALRLLYLTPVHRQFFIDHAEDLIAFRHGEEVPPERLVVSAMMYLENSVVKNFADDTLRRQTTFGKKRKNGLIRELDTRIRALKHAHLRLQKAVIECKDAFDVIQDYDADDAIFYLDPPYHEETLGSEKQLYALENIDHVRFVDLLLRLRGKAIMSCYDHPVYHPLLEAGWQRRYIKRPFVQKIGNTDKVIYKTETLYISPGVAGYQSELF